MSLRALRQAPPWATILVCCVSQFMVVLDVSIVNVALPQMRSELGLTMSGQQWVVNAYTLTFAGFLLLGGRVADLFGRRRVFLLGLALFTAFSLIGGLAQNGTWLIAARAAQGLSGAVLAPATLSLLTSRFTDPQERRRALGAWSTTAASGAAIGVLAGGVLTDFLDWRWVLFVNVPIGVAVLALAVVALVESEVPRRDTALDVLGAITVTLGMSVVVYGIVETERHPWGSARTIGTLAFGVAVLIVFALVETRFAKDPLIPFSVFRRRSLLIANGLATAVGTALFGTFFFLSLYLQEIAGYSPLRAGLAFLPSALSTFVAALVGTRIVERLGIRRQLIIGPTTAAVGVIWLATTLQVNDAYVSHLLGPLVLLGVGLGLTFVPMTLAATHGVPPHQAGLASGLINTTRQIGGAVGLAVMAAVAVSVTKNQLASETATPAEALTTGYDRAFLLAGVVLAAGALLVLGLPRVLAQGSEAPAVSLDGRGAQPLPSPRHSRGGSAYRRGGRSRRP